MLAERTVLAAKRLATALHSWQLAADTHVFMLRDQWPLGEDKSAEPLARIDGNTGLR
jgi:hypothetical protein